MLELKVDCPYCEKPMKVELANLSPDGCHYLIPPHNIPWRWSRELYYFRCDNGHPHITISAYEYYFANNGRFDGTVQFLWMELGYRLDKNKQVSFHAVPGKTPYIYVYYWPNPYMEQFKIDCTEEWLSWSPDKIIEMMKLTMQEHFTEFNAHFEGCEEWDD